VEIALKDATFKEVSALSKYHYRALPNQPFVRAWKLTKDGSKYGQREDLIGIITYSMPVLNSGSRRLATGGFFTGGTKRMQLRRLNDYVRRIGRIIIDPRYRGIGLASRLIAETMPKLGVAMVEATAVMGRLSGFFERAGMRRFEAPIRPQAAALSQALKAAGIKERLWIDSAAVQEKIELLDPDSRAILEKHIHRFLGAYGKRRTMPAGTERMRFVLSRLNARPAYYAWLNPKKKVEGLFLKTQNKYNHTKITL